MSSSPFMTPDAGPVRAAIERRAALVVVWLAHLPRAVPPAVVAVVFVVGAFLHGIVAAVLLLLVVAVMGLLSFLSWPSVPGPVRAFRLVILAAVIAFAVGKLA